MGRVDEQRSSQFATGQEEGAVVPLIDLSRLAFNLLQRWRLISLTTAAMTFAAAAYVTLATPIYTAQAVILVDPREVRLTEANAVLSGIGSDSAAITSQLAVLRSRELLMPVFEAEDVFRNPEFSDAGESKDVVFDKLLNSLKVERQGLTYVIEVSFRSKSAQTAARIANAIVAAYISGQTDEKSRATVQATGLLEDQVVGMRESVAKAEEAVENFRSQNGMLDIEVGKSLLQSQVDQLNQQVLAARERARQAQNRYDQAKSLEGRSNALVSNSDILSSATADELRREYNLRSVEQSRLSRIYGQSHPQIVSIRSQMAQLETLMKAEIGLIVRRLDNELKLANDDVKKAEADLASLRDQSNKMGQKEVELRQLQLQAQTSREVLQQFLRRAQETKQLDGLQRAEARIISAAVPPDRPIWPKSKLLLAVAGLLGLMLGCVIAVLLGPVTPKPVREKAWRASFSPRGRPKKALPTIATVLIDDACLQGGRDFARTCLPAAKLFVKQSPTSQFSRGIWALIGRIVDHLDPQKTPHLLIFTDLGARAGKYCLTYNIGQALRRLGATVLVLDMDPYERPRDYIDLEREAFGAAPLDRAALLDFVTRLPTVYHTKNKEPANGRGLGVNVIDTFLEKAAGRFDFIIVNAPSWDRGHDLATFNNHLMHLFVVMPQGHPWHLNRSDIESTIGANVSAAGIQLTPIATSQIDYELDADIGLNTRPRRAI